MKRIAIMQGYLLPYAGYFRLMCDVDAFVLSNSTQFARRGWVHRNRLRDDRGRLLWFTLPLAPSPLGTLINDIQYGHGAARILRKSARRFAACRNPREHTAALVKRAMSVEETPAATIEALLRRSADVLGLRTPFVRDTELNLPAELRGSERVFTVCAALGADTYVNAPGGRDLYDPAEFARRGVRLEFLPDYRSDHSSILQRLHESTPAEILAEIRANLR